MSERWLDVAPASALAPGERMVVFLGDDTRVGVFNIDGEYFAVHDVCTHDFAEMCEDGEIEGCEIICPRHGARFDLRSGEALTPPAYEPVETFAVRVADGRVQVADRD